MSVKNITVLGSGVMGHGIAQVSATAGYNVVLRDIKQEFLDKAMEKIKWSLDKLVSKEKISKEEGDSIFARITPIVDLNDAVKNAELVIEVVPEIMDLKKSVYAELDKAAGPEVIFASNKFCSNCSINPFPLLGSQSLPSVKACTNTFLIPSFCANSHNLYK